MRVAMGAGGAPRKLRERGGEKGAGPGARGSGRPPAGADWPLGAALRARGAATPAAAPAVPPTCRRRLAAAAAAGGREERKKERNRGG